VRLQAGEPDRDLLERKVEAESPIGRREDRQRRRRDLRPDAVALHHDEVDGGIGTVGRHYYRVSSVLRAGI
jgi:hypothetical protein